MGNWSDLSNDILGLIVDQFSAIEDIVHFGAVCRPCRSVSVEKWHFFTVYPWLMLPVKEDSDNRDFYSLSTQKVYHLNMPEARGKRCWSSCGWLITARLGSTLEISLLNPFSRVQIRVPPQPTQREYLTGLRKVTLSSRPSLKVKTTPCEYDDDDDDCMVMGIFSQFRKLAILRLGEEVWTLVDGHIGITDVIHFNGQFYAITNRGKLLIVDISGPNPKTIEFAEGVGGINFFYFYLVEFVGELFMLARLFSEDDAYFYETNGFAVYKFNFENKKWTQVKSLDNCALFVGANTSFSISPSNHLGCEPNCIYFSDDNIPGVRKRGGYDIGVFRMGTEEVDHLNVDCGAFSRYFVPLWICPSL